MQTKSILFSTPMVRAILEGQKNITRRVIKPQPKCRLSYVFAGTNNGKWDYPPKEAAKSWGESYRQPKRLTDADRNRLWTPPCHGDDILWVRETWGTWSPSEGIMPQLYYRADANAPAAIQWRPSIHMPREAARIFLRVTQVSVERLRDMPRNDIVREGVTTGSVSEFRKLWDGQIKPADIKQYGWKANPWVWVISFERCEKPEAR